MAADYLKQGIVMHTLHRKKIHKILLFVLFYLEHY